MELKKWGGKTPVDVPTTPEIYSKAK